MGALVGFVVGYMLGAKQGPDGYAKLRQTVDTVLGSPEFKAMVERGLDLSALLGFQRDGKAGANGAAGQLKALLEHNGEMGSSWRTIADSETVKSLVAGGLSLASGLLERGMAFLGERRNGTS